MLRKLSTYEDMDKTINDNTLRININAREYDSYLPSKLSISNSETITLDTELPEAGGSETSSENRNCFVSTITADKALSTFRPPSSNSTKSRTFFQSFKRILMVRHYDHGFLNNMYYTNKFFFFHVRLFREVLQDQTGRIAFRARFCFKHVMFGI